MIEPVGSGEVMLWVARLDTDRALVEQYRSTLSDDERARAARFAFPLHRDRFLVGRGIVRAVLSRHIGRAPSALALGYGAFGKPELAEDALQFNVSHSGDRMVVAVAADMPVGVDIEGPVAEAELRAIVEIALSDAERAAIDRRPEAERPGAVLDAWTRKEACLKALGIGLTADVRSASLASCACVAFSLPENIIGTIAALRPIARIRQGAWPPASV